MEDRPRGMSCHDQTSHENARSEAASVVRLPVQRARAMHDDLFAPEVVHDPYTYFGRLREEDPIQWNARDEAWLITRYDDVVWLTRHPALFSPAVFMGSSQAASHRGAADLQDVFSDMFIRRDRPTH